MKDFQNSSCVYLEIGQTSLKALDGNHGLEVPLERLANGRLTGPCKEKLTHNLRSFLKNNTWGTRRRALCAIGARGVSVRRLTLPASAKEDLERLLLLQIESEFPLPPDELAWGWRPIGENHEPTPTSTPKQELLVIAVKKEVLTEYADVLVACGLAPVFTLSALARARLAPQPSASYALLEVEGAHSELASFENGVPTALRVLPWGGETMTRPITEGLESGHDKAAQPRLRCDQGQMADGEVGLRARPAVQAALDSLARFVDGSGVARRIFVTAKSGLLTEIVTGLTARLGAGTPCEPLPPPQGEGRSTAILGLKRAVEEDGGRPLLILQIKPSNGAPVQAPPAPWKWAAYAALLAMAALAFPVAEAILLKPRLSKRLSAIKADQARLGLIDRELGFLQFLKQNQPPYLDALYLLSKAASPGTRLESLSMNRRGDLSLRGSFRDNTQVAEFRSKLLESGFFSTVVVDDQTPTPDRQKVNVRISAQWKSPVERESLAIGPAAAELAKPKPGRAEPAPGAAPKALRPSSETPSGLSPAARPASSPSRTISPGPDAKE